MRPRPLLAGLCCLALLAAACAGGGGGGTTYTVTVGPGGAMTFDPSTVTIHPGDTVKWVWGSDFHSVTSGNTTTCTLDGRFCSPADTTCNAGTLSNTGATYSHTFTDAGTYPYFCLPHCTSGMKGSVVVAP